MTAETAHPGWELTVVGGLPRSLELDPAALGTHGLAVSRADTPRYQPGEIVLVADRSRAAPAGPGAWVALTSSGRVQLRRRRATLTEAEAILVSSEEERQRVEALLPATIGRVWVVPDLAATGAPILQRLAMRHRPEGGGGPGPTVPLRIGVIGYNLKFITRIVEHLDRLPHASVLVREWPRYAVDDDPEETVKVISWAETIVCEWCGPNAVLASRSKGPGQRLVVRLHRFELEREDWRDVEIDAVDTVVTVGPHYRRKVLEQTGWPASKVIEVPNWVDTEQLDRPKLPGAGHTLGLLGAIPSRKRLDRALDLIETLRAEDRRFVLRVKSEHPWDHRWIREDEGERAFFEEHLPRLEALVEEAAVIVDPPGKDVASWFRGVGIILSTSDDESFHLSPAEGMASGAVPVVWGWPGADEVYHRRWVAGSREALVERCREASDPDRRPELVRLAREEVGSRYDLAKVLRSWEAIVGIGEGQSP